MIKDGRPYTHGDTSLITSYPKDVQEKVFHWIRENIKPIKSPNYGRSSYGIKHILQADTNIYLTNNEFKDAMMICGFCPVNPNDVNWFYRISQKSPAFVRTNSDGKKEPRYEV